MKLFILHAFFFLVLSFSAFAGPGNVREVGRDSSLATTAPPITMSAAVALVGTASVGLVFLAAVVTRAASDPQWEFRKGLRAEDALVPTLFFAFVTALILEDLRPETAEVTRGVRYGVGIAAAAFYSGLLLVVVIFRQTRKNLKSDLCPNAQPSPAT